jgi:hypothetical protein
MAWYGTSAAGQAHLCHASAMIDPSTLSRCPLLVMRRQPLARSSSSLRMTIACFTMRFGTLSRRMAPRTIRFLAASRGMRETTLAQKAFRSSSLRRPFDASTLCRNSDAVSSSTRAVFASAASLRAFFTFSGRRSLTSDMLRKECSTCRVSSSPPNVKRSPRNCCARFFASAALLEPGAADASSCSASFVLCLLCSLLTHRSSSRSCCPFFTLAVGAAVAAAGVVVVVAAGGALAVGAVVGAAAVQASRATASAASSSQTNESHAFKCCFCAAAKTFAGLKRNSRG